MKVALPTQAMATPDEDLSQLEKDLRVLKIEYEQYFGGGRSRPPSDTQWRVDQIVRRYSDRGSELNYAQRFRYNNLSTTYAKYQEIWRKRLRQKEEGMVEHHYGAAAKAVEANRTQEMLRQKSSTFVMTCSDPGRDAEKVEQLYRALLEARKKSEERGEPPAPDTFRQFIQSKTEQLKRQAGASEVEYTVAVEGGQVKLKAKVKQ